MNKESRNVYIACSMIKAQLLDFSLLDLLSIFVKDQHMNPFIPGKMIDAPPKVIFDRDMNWLKQSDFIIADVNEPSHGVGMEIMYAYEHDIPVVCLLNTENKPLSRMVEGSPHVFLVEYATKQDLMETLNDLHLSELEVKECRVCQNKALHKSDKCLKC